MSISISTYYVYSETLFNTLSQLNINVHIDTLIVISRYAYQRLLGKTKKTVAFLPIFGDKYLKN